MFAKPEPQLCMIFNRWQHLLTSFNQPLLNPTCLQEFLDAIHDEGAALDNCWGFIDGTVRPISCPGRHQCIMYNGHKKIHTITFQSVVASNGLQTYMAQLRGKGMIVQSWPNHNCYPSWRTIHLVQMVIFYVSMVILPILYGSTCKALFEELDYLSTSKARIAVEWIFGDIVNYFKFLDFKKD